MLNTLAPGFSRAAIEELSRHKGEPEWMLQLRLQAWDTYEKTEAPLGRRGDLGTYRTFAGFDLQQLQPFPRDLVRDRAGQPGDVAAWVREARD